MLRLVTILPERIFQLLRDMRVSIFSRGFKFRVPVDAVLSMAFTVPTTKMLPVFGELETSTNKDLLGLIIFDGP